MVVSSENPEFTQAQGFIDEVMTREFNVAGITMWYEEVFGSEFAFLPEIIKRDKDEQGDEHNYTIPVSEGKVVTTFGQGREGITVGTSEALPVEVIKEGWVVFVGERKELRKGRYH